MLRLLIFCCLFAALGSVYGQEQLHLSGALQTTASFYLRDSLIGAANIPQYDRQKFGADTWVNVNVAYRGWEAGLRFDAFQNSQLLNPSASYSAEGIGAWYVSKQVNKLGIRAGYIYEQFGSGIIFRAFEERPLLIDNALKGIRLQYDLNDNWRIRGISGRQKQQFDTYESVIRGLNAEGFIRSDSASRWTLAPGVGAVARTLDDNSMNNLVAALNTYPEAERFVPRYNAYAFTLYNTLTAGRLAWYFEAAYKTDDNLNDPFGVSVRDGVPVTGDLFYRADGSVLYSSLTWAGNNWGLTLEGKRTENFSFRTRPQAALNRGMVNFLPPLTRVNTYRLTSRYNAATQELGEWAAQLDLRYAPSRKLSFNLNGSYLDDLQGTALYREMYAEVQYKHLRLWQLTGGLQLQHYNQARYEFKPEAPAVETIVPFVDFLYKLDRRKSLRTEWQYMRVGEDEAAGLPQDYGDWLFALIELNLAPRWTFSLSDMYNVRPGRNSPVGANGDRQKLHYPRADVFYSKGAYRFSLSYIKQVEGVVCTGGICRLEPAFSGVRATVQATF